MVRCDSGKATNRREAVRRRQEGEIQDAASKTNLDQNLRSTINEALERLANQMY